MSCCQNIYIYFSLSIKLIFNLLILTALLISTININILKTYQKFYFVISIIIWLLINIKYFTILFMIILLKILKKKFHCEKLIKIIFITFWSITNIPAYIIMLIAFIYDICQMLDGNKTNILYECIFSTICIIFICFSINDYYHLDILFYFICEKIEIHIEKNIQEKTQEKVAETSIDEFEFDINELKAKIFESVNNKNKKKVL